MDLQKAMSVAEKLIMESPVEMNPPHPIYDDFTYWRTHKERFRRTVMIFNQHKRERPIRLLDIGSHFLHFAIIMHLLGYETYGCDMAEFGVLPAIQQRADRLSIENLVIQPLDQLRTLPYRTQQFDAVFLLETIEHFNANPKVLIKEIYRILRPGGRIVITTPNYYSYQKLGWRIVRILKGEGGYIPVKELIGEENFTHHWKEYSRRELRELFSSFGFRELFFGSLTGLGGNFPRWIYRLCRPWGLFMYVEYAKEEYAITSIVS